MAIKNEPGRDPAMVERTQKLNVVFALTSIGLLVVFSLMVWADYDREWKKYQKKFTGLEVQLTEVDSEIAAALSQDSTWAAAATRLQSIKGVGWVTAAWTLVTTLNFTSCDTVDALTA